MSVFVRRRRVRALDRTGASYASAAECFAGVIARQSGFSERVGESAGADVAENRSLAVGRVDADRPVLAEAVPAHDDATTIKQREREVVSSLLAGGS
jgi:hypothetical protein